MNIALKLTEYLDKKNSNSYIREGIWHNEYGIFYTKENYSSAPRILKDLKEIFPDCTINHYKGCCEFEVIGPNYRKFYNRYEEVLESLTDDPKHQIFMGSEVVDNWQEGF